MEIETTGMILRTIGALALILGLLLIALFGLRRWGDKLRGKESSLIQVLASRMIHPKKYIFVVRVGSQTLILGSSEQGLNVLGTLENVSPQPDGGSPGHV